MDLSHLLKVQKPEGAKSLCNEGSLIIGRRPLREVGIFRIESIVSPYKNVVGIIWPNRALIQASRNGAEVSIYHIFKQPPLFPWVRKQGVWI